MTLDQTINELNEAFAGFKESQDQKLQELASRLEEIEVAKNRPSAGGGKVQFDSIGDAATKFALTIDGQHLPVLEKQHRLSDYLKADDLGWSIGDYVKANMGLQTKDSVTSGAATVPQAVSGRIIDRIRQKSRIVQAGAVTIALPGGPVNVCKITGDPTVHQHSEGSEDISDSKPTFEAVNLDPKALVAAIPLSMEIVQDSPNLDAALEASISGAFAKKLDDLCLTTILDAASASPSEVLTDSNDPSKWSGVLSGVSTMLSNDLEVPQAMIVNPADKVSRHSQQAKVYDGTELASEGPWLGVPPLLQQTADLDTSGISAGKAIYGGFGQGFAIAVRLDVRMEMLRFHQYKSGSHVLVVYARQAGYVLQGDALMVQDNS